MRRLPAAAKINLALVVGPKNRDGRHELTTIFQRIDLVDRIALAPADELEVLGFTDDTLVRDALGALASRAGVPPAWAVTIHKRIPVAAGLGGGSSDAATALRLANETLAAPVSDDRLRCLAASLGADVPFFLAPGPQLGEGDGGQLSPLDLPQDYWVVLVLPRGTTKRSTASIYAAFDARDGGSGYAARSAALLAALGSVRRPRDLADLPPNDLASSPLAAEFRSLGAFRADVTGAGPVVYGLFHQERAARAAAARLRSRGRTWVTVPSWYF